MPNYKNIIFSDHCKDMQADRSITKQQKLHVINEPTNEVPAKRKKRRKFWKKIDGTKLAVILKEVDDAKKALVVTCYWWDN